MIPRKCHIKRIYGKNVSDDSENTDVWIDVLRIDELGSVENAGGQVKNIRLKWNDNPATPGQDTASNPARTMRTVRINPADSTIYFEVKAIDRLITSESDQRVIRIHKNTSANTARTATRKRVYHLDVTLPGSATWEEYIAALADAADTVDESQYIDVELVSAFGTKQMQGALYQTDTHNLKLNKALGDIQSVSPVSTAARLDPFQMVVNVSTRSVQFIQLQFTGALSAIGFPTSFQYGDDGIEVSQEADSAGFAKYVAFESNSISTAFEAELVGIDGIGISSMSYPEKAAILSQITITGTVSGSRSHAGRYSQVIANDSEPAAIIFRESYGIDLADFYDVGPADEYPNPTGPSLTIPNPFGTTPTRFKATTDAIFKLFGSFVETGYIYNIIGSPSPRNLLARRGDVTVITEDIISFSDVGAEWNGFTFAAVAARSREILLKRTDLIERDGF